MSKGEGRKKITATVLGLLRLDAMKNRTPKMLLVVIIGSLVWTGYAFLSPIRMPVLPEDGLGEVEGHGFAKESVRELKVCESLINNRRLFAPAVPVLSRGTGRTGVIEKILKETSLAGITSVRGQATAVISVKGKTGLYRAGDESDAFLVKRVLGDKVVLEIDSEEVELVR